MDIIKNKYYAAKDVYQEELDYATKIEGRLTEETIARLHCDYVEYNLDKESDIISEILFQEALIEKTGCTSYVAALTRAINQFDNSYKFTVLNDEEYEDLKSIVEKLKGYLAEHSM